MNAVTGASREKKDMIQLHITYAELDQSKAISLREFRKRYHIKGRRSRPINLETLRRWANPKRGFRPAGAKGATVLFPTLSVGHERYTMPEWVDWFFAECDRIREEIRIAEREGASHVRG